MRTVILWRPTTPARPPPPPPPNPSFLCPPFPRRLVSLSLSLALSPLVIDYWPALHWGWGWGHRLRGRRHIILFEKVARRWRRSRDSTHVTADASAGEKMAVRSPRNELRETPRLWEEGGEKNIKAVVRQDILLNRSLEEYRRSEWGVSIPLSFIPLYGNKYILNLE